MKRKKKKKRNPALIHAKHRLLTCHSVLCLSRTVQDPQMKHLVMEEAAGGQQQHLLPLALCHPTPLPPLLHIILAMCSHQPFSLSQQSSDNVPRPFSACCSFSWCGGANLKLQALNKIFNVWGIHLVNASVLTHKVWSQKKQKCIVKPLWWGTNGWRWREYTSPVSLEKVN